MQKPTPSQQGKQRSQIPTEKSGCLHSAKPATLTWCPRCRKYHIGTTCGSRSGKRQCVLSLIMNSTDACMRTHTRTHTHTHTHSAFDGQGSPGDAITLEHLQCDGHIPSRFPPYYTCYVWEAQTKPCAHGGLWTPTGCLHSLPACRLDLVKPLDGRSHKHPRGMPPICFTQSHRAELYLFNVVCVLSCFSRVRLQPTRLLCPWELSRQGYWSGVPCPPPRLFNVMTYLS